MGGIIPRDILPRDILPHEIVPREILPLDTSWQLFLQCLRGGVQAFQFRKQDFDLWVGGDGLDMYQQL